MFMLVEVHLSNLVFMTILVAVAQLSAMVFAASGINAASDNNLLEVMRDIPYFSLTVILIETAQIEAHFQDALTKRTALVPINNAFLDTRTDIMIHFLTDEGWNLHLRHFLMHHMFHKEIHTYDFADGSYARIETLSDDLITLESSNYDGIIVNNVAKLVLEDATASNGVILAIDNVLNPTWYDTNIADLLKVHSNRFFTLVSADENNAEFMDVISSSSWDSYTVFAPLDKAISDLDVFDSVGTLDMQSFLRHHIVPGINSDDDLMRATKLRSLMGKTLEVEFDAVQRTLRINGYMVIQSNILASNGIMHIIDGILLPVTKTKYVHTTGTEDIQSGLPITKGNVNITEPRCGCPSCPISCVAQIELLKSSGYDEINSCLILVSEGLSTLECEKCKPSKCSSNLDLNITATLLRKQEYNKCLFLKQMEEFRGDSEVKCNCERVRDFEVAFELKCKGATNITCSPKYSQCDTSESCCSNPLRRCTGGQCRDAVRPRRKRKHGSKLGLDGRFASRLKNKAFDYREGRNPGIFSSF